MSAGKVHLQASVLLSLTFVTLSFREPVLLQCAVGSMIGCMISPDLDVDAGNISNTLIKKKVGWFGEKLWRWFWRGYSGSFKHGRFASHFPVFSTFVRLFYIFFMLIVPFYLVYPHVVLPIGFTLSVERELVWWLKIMFTSWFTVGLCSSDLIHVVLDVLTKESK